MADTSTTLAPCADCGMPCALGEYHPYAACLMFKACRKSDVVRANLDAVRRAPAPASSEPVAGVPWQCGPQASGFMAKESMDLSHYYRQRAEYERLQIAAAIPGVRGPRPFSPAALVQPVAVPAGMEPVAHLIVRSAFRASPDGQDAEGKEWLEEAHSPDEPGAFAVFTAAQVQAMLAKEQESRKTAQQQLEECKIELTQLEAYRFAMNHGNLLPPGWKAVPVKCPTAICCAIEREIDSQLAASGISAPMHRQDGMEIWRAALAAAPSGLVDKSPNLQARAVDKSSEVQGSGPALVPLTDEQIDLVAEAMPDGLSGFLKSWGYRQFAREILALLAMPTWEPEFDCMTPGQEELTMQFCQEIAGKRGKKGNPPDPVRLLEMAEALYKVERAAAHGITGEPL